MRTSLLFVLLGIFYFQKSTAVQYEGSICPKDWTFNPQNRQCYFISEQYARFDVAARICKEMNSSLASILSSDELLFILPLILVQRQTCKSLDDCSNYWIGSRNLSSSYNIVHMCTWINRSSLSNKTSFWGSDLSSNKHNCGSLSVLSDSNKMDGYWKDENCDKPMRYICKRALPAVKKGSKGTGYVHYNITIIRDCPQGFVRPRGSYYCYKILSEFLNNTAAANRCRGFDNAQLAIIESSAENEIVANYLKEEFGKNSSFCTLRYWKDKNQSVWLNGKKKNPANCSTPYVWRTADGVEIPVNFTDWYQLPPDCADREESCIHISDKFDYKWNYIRCNWESCALCQKDIRTKT